MCSPTAQEGEVERALGRGAEDWDTDKRTAGDAAAGSYRPK